MPHLALFVGREGGSRGELGEGKEREGGRLRREGERKRVEREEKREK